MQPFPARDHRPRRNDATPGPSGWPGYRPERTGRSPSSSCSSPGCSPGSSSMAQAGRRGPCGRAGRWPDCRHGDYQRSPPSRAAAQSGHGARGRINPRRPARRRRAWRGAGCGRGAETISRFRPGYRSGRRSAGSSGPSRRQGKPEADAWAATRRLPSRSPRARRCPAHAPRPTCYRPRPGAKPEPLACRHCPQRAAARAASSGSR